MTRTTSISIEGCAAVVSNVFDSIFDSIDLWRLAVEHHAAAHDGRLTRKGVDDLIEDIVVPEFARERSSVIGAGFVAAPGVIVDADWHLAWWLGDLNTFGMGSTAPHIRRLETVEDPAAENFRDYTVLEWWRVPSRTGRRHITGPYVDYLCTDEYTLTLTEPVSFREELIGVVGADLYAEDIERALLPQLRAAAGSSVTLVNPSGRVLVSTDVHLATGSLLRLDGLAATLRESSSTARLPTGQLVVPCADTCLSLVVAQGSSSRQ